MQYYHYQCHSVIEDGTFTTAAQVLVTWLERGDCTRRTASVFYGLIQSTNTHIRRLLGEKASYETELQQMKLQFRQKLQAIIRQSKWCHLAGL